MFVTYFVQSIPALRAAQKAAGVLFCEAETRNGYRHTLTARESKEHMAAYRACPEHLKAMKAFHLIAEGKTYGYESDTVPNWQEALILWEKYGKATY